MVISVLLSFKTPLLGSDAIWKVNEVSEGSGSVAFNSIVWDWVSSYALTVWDWATGLSFVSETEIQKINNFLRSQGEAEYFDEILSYGDDKNLNINNKNNDKDELYQTAVEVIKTEGKASTSFLQRKLQIGYNRAARIIDTMESEGIVSKANHVGKRDVIK